MLYPMALLSTGPVRYTSRQVGRMLAPARMGEVKAIVMRLVRKAMSADTELSPEEDAPKN